MSKMSKFTVNDDQAFMPNLAKDTETTTEASPEGKVSEIPASKLRQSPFNKGLDMNNVPKLAESFRETGLIAPISVYDLGDGTYEIYNGNQRFEAWCYVLGHSSIPAIVSPYEKDLVKRFKVHTEANTLSREKNMLFWTSRIDVARKVLQELGFAGSKAEELQELSSMLGLSQAQIYRYDGFSKLIPELREFESKKWLSATTLYEAVKLEPYLQKEVAKRVNEKYVEYEKLLKDGTEEFEITRQAFKKIVQEVKTGVKPERKKSITFSERIESATNSYLKVLSNPKTEEERAASLKEIERLEAELKKLKKNFKE